MAASSTTSSRASPRASASSSPSWPRPPIPPLTARMRRTASRRAQQDRIYQFLAAQTEPVSLAQIIAELGLKSWTATSTLNRLQRKGRIEHPGHDAWQIRKPPPAQAWCTG